MFFAIPRHAFSVAAIGVACAAGAMPAAAQHVDHDKVSCPAVAKADMKPQQELQKKLTAEGWKVRQVKNFKGCYEVYGFNEKGERAEAFFHPGTFEKVGEVKKP